MAQQNQYDFLTRAELLDQLKFTQSELNKVKIKAEPTEEADKQAAANVKAQLETEINNIKAALKATITAPPGGPLAPPMDQDMVKTMKDTAAVQNLLEVVRTVPKLNVGDSMERFVSELDQIYKVEVQPQVGDLTSLETEFVRASKRLLPFSMYEQMDKSGTDTSTWTDMKKYLIDVHGSKITMFQHLNRLWRLELKPEEKLTDYGSRLEEQAYQALLHIRKTFGKDHKAPNGTPKSMTDDDVFKLITAMLASLQVQKEHEDVFKAMIKGMDKHWSATSLLADAQDYVDRLGSNRNTTKTGAEVAFHSRSNKNKSPDESEVFRKLQQQLEANTKAIQSLTLTNTSAQTGERSVTVSQEDIDKIIQDGKGKPRDQQICLHFLNGNCNSIGKCRYGRKHVKGPQVYMATQEDIEPEVPEESHPELDEFFQ